jgi:PTH2 family peptidyl-tRNA hydrolase
MEAKQVIVIRRDLGMRRGKEISQGAHASMAWMTTRLEQSHSHPGIYTLILNEAEQSWLSGLFTKITCQVQSEENLRAVVVRAEEAGVIAHAITDAGKTEFGGVPTLTAVAVGPDWADRVDEVTGNLKLY